MSSGAGRAAGGERVSASARGGAVAARGPPFPLVLLDTNLLLLPFQRGFPLEDALASWCPASALRVPTAVRGELERLAERAVAGAANAVELARRFPGIQSHHGGDAGLLELARRSGGVVATGDQELRRRLVTAGVSVLFPRGKNRLELAPGESPRRTLLREHPQSTKRVRSRRTT
jgi:rRNA-processing protein FCF1